MNDRLRGCMNRFLFVLKRSDSVSICVSPFSALKHPLFLQFLINLNFFPNNTVLRSGRAISMRWPSSRHKLHIHGRFRWPWLLQFGNADTTYDAQGKFTGMLFIWIIFEKTESLHFRHDTRIESHCYVATTNRGKSPKSTVSTMNVLANMAIQMHGNTVAVSSIYWPLQP